MLDDATTKAKPYAPRHLVDSARRLLAFIGEPGTPGYRYRARRLERSIRRLYATFERYDSTDEADHLESLTYELMPITSREWRECLQEFKAGIEALVIETLSRPHPCRFGVTDEPSTMPQMVAYYANSYHPGLAEEWRELAALEATEALAVRLARLVATLDLDFAIAEVAAEAASTRAPPLLNQDLLSSSPWSHRGPPTPLAGGSRTACTQRRRRRKIEAVPLS